jgi:DNA-binding NarL/FixJ family response regulator
MNEYEQAALEEKSQSGRSESMSASSGPDRRGQADGDASLPTRILIVEDETWIAIELQHALSNGGYEVVGLAADADTAVRLAGERRPALVLMDIHLAGRGDGIEAALRIRERFGVRSVFLSGHLDAATRRRLEATQPFSVLDKPVTPGELLRTVASALTGQRAG